VVLPLLEKPTTVMIAGAAGRVSFAVMGRLSPACRRFSFRADK
jgi:hypothetical protein